MNKVIIGDSRNMSEVKDNSIALVVTSPPYPMIKIWDDFFHNVGITFAAKSNIVCEQMHEYLYDVWDQLDRKLIDGGIVCINIGDATRKINGKFRLFANHATIMDIFDGKDFVTLPYILWKKPTTKPNAFLGSGFYPPNAYVTLDCEFILIFRKGNLRRPPTELRKSSKYTKEQRDVWFSQIWNIAGARQTVKGIESRVGAFPEEIPRRLIQMFSVKGDTVLDPFLGTGTTMKIANRLSRNCIGYEINRELLPTIEKKTCTLTSKVDF